MFVRSLFPLFENGALAEAAQGIYFHVTLESRLKSIMVSGIQAGRKRMWNNAFGTKLGQRDRIYLFSSLTEAVRWAARMQWEFKKPVVILKIANPPGQIEADTGMGLHASSGTAWTTDETIPATSIVNTIPLTDTLVRSLVANDRIDEMRLDEDPSARDWLLYAQDGVFVVYDKNMIRYAKKGLPPNNDFIKGSLRISISGGDGHITRFGAQTPYLKRFLLTLGAAYCSFHGVPLILPQKFSAFTDEKMVKIQRDIENGQLLASSRSKMDWNGVAKAEREFRKSVDSSDQFLATMLDIARRKYDTVREAVLDEKTGPLPEPHNPQNVNPALLTLDEYLKIANPQDKWHPNEAYDVTLASLNSHGPKREDGRLLGRVKLGGIAFEFRVFVDKLTYHKRDANDEWLRDENGDLVAMTDDEIAQRGARTHDYMICVYDDEGRRAASAQDEWGAMLIMVAREYRGFGLGPRIGKVARSLDPTKSSGGFTQSGYNNFVKVYREFVRDALTSGLYRDKVRSGEMTMERVREILASARLDQKPRKPDINLSVNDPKDWLLLAEWGGFTLYDKKLKDVITDHRYEWGERFIKGHLLVRINQTARAGEQGILVHFGGDTDKIKAFLIACAASFCEKENVPLALDDDDLRYADPAKYEIGERSNATGFWRTPVQIKLPLNLALVAKPEQVFRRSFDAYDEFKNGVLELGEAKFRRVNEGLREETLAEGRDAPLYHATDAMRAAQIIAFNRINAFTASALKSNHRGVSFSRDRSFAHHWWQADWSGAGRVVLVFDQARMVRDGHRFEAEAHPDSARFGGDQSEEFHVGHIEDVNKYLIGIEMTQDTHDHLASLEASDLPRPSRSIERPSIQAIRAMLKDKRLRIVPGRERDRSMPRKALPKGIPVNEAIDELESLWAGGISGFGDKRAARWIQDEPGYDAYVEALRASLSFPLTVYRLMPMEVYDDWTASPYSDQWATTTDPTFVEKFRRFAGHDKSERVVVKITVTNPQAVIMKGKAEEKELVIDSGWIEPEDTDIVSSRSVPEAVQIEPWVADLSKVRKFAKDLNVDFEAVAGRKGYSLLWIDAFRANTAAGKGQGAKVVQALCDVADEHGKDIRLSVWENSEDLVTYYKRFGFALTGDKWASGEWEMLRTPKTGTAITEIAHTEIDDDDVAREMRSEKGELVYVGDFGTLAMLAEEEPLKDDNNFVFITQMGGNRVGIASMHRVFDTKVSNLFSVSLIWLEKSARQNGNGFAFYAYWLDRGVRFMADSTQSPQSRALWQKLAKTYEVWTFDGEKPLKRVRDTSEVYGDPDLTLIARKPKGGDPRTLDEDAFHGSPHQFTRFSTDHIGTGEGAAMYGWGLYFAGAKKVAEYYANMLGKRDAAGPNDLSTKLRDLSYTDLNAAIEKASEIAVGHARTGFSYQYFLPDGSMVEFDRYDDVGTAHGKTKGSVYSATIPEEDHYLLWDAKLTDQPAPVRKALAKIDHPVINAWRTNGAWENTTGASLYKALAGGIHKGNNSGMKAASQALDALGIVGNKYLDANSRQQGAGSFNYVVFNDKHVSLKEAMQGFHGSDRSFKAFKLDKQGWHPSKVGVWFASKPEAAERIGNDVAKSSMNKPMLYTAILHIQNPKRYDTYRDFLEDFDELGGGGGGAAKMRRTLMRQGYDGIEITHSDTDYAGDRTDWAVFDPADVEIIERRSPAPVSEAYFATQSVSDEDSEYITADVEIFKNPSVMELGRLMREFGFVRGFLDLEDGALYAWRGDVLHHLIETPGDIWVLITRDSVELEFDHETMAERFGEQDDYTPFILKMRNVGVISRNRKVYVSRR